MKCAVCDSSLGKPDYTSKSRTSVTSVCTVLSTELLVHLCRHCGFVQTRHLSNLELAAFWEQYHTLQAAAPDSVYSRTQTQLRMRSEQEAFQLELLLALPWSATVAFIGGVRTAALAVLRERRPDLQIKAFIEDRIYAPSIGKMVPPVPYHIGSLPNDSARCFDYVVSLYELAHEKFPLKGIQAYTALLKPGGRLLVAVPDLLSNSGDLVVANHFSHFSADALQTVLEKSGLSEIRVDATAFEGRLFATAKYTGDIQTTSRKPDADSIERIESFCRYWSEFGDRVKEFEKTQGHNGPAAIYGAGFYGAFILSQLAHPGAVESFYDRGSLSAGREIGGFPVRPASQLPSNQKVLYIGLNPETARTFDDSQKRKGLATFFP